MRLKYTKNRFWLDCQGSLEAYRAAKKAGWLLNKPTGLLYTLEPFLVLPYVEHAVDEVTSAKMAGYVLKYQRSYQDCSSLSVPAPEGLEYRPFQKAGIDWLVEHENALLADDMGLGKTIQIAGLINCIEPRNVLVVAPKSAKKNWQRELEKWMVNYYPVQIIDSKSEWPEYPSIVIINYDILSKFERGLQGRVWDLLVIDEAHYIKNPDADRTRQIVGHMRYRKVMNPGIQAHRVVALTGTPIVNRPEEMFTILRYLNPVQFGNWWEYAKRFCAAYNDGYGWNTSGASNLDELNFKARTTCMIRRTKAEVLKQLPPKVRQVIEIPADGDLAAVLRKEQKVMKAFRDQVKDLGVVDVGEMSEMAVMRHETALAKVPAISEHVNDILAEGHKVVLFAWHHDVIAAFYHTFKDVAVRLTGQSTETQRQTAIDKFQENQHVRLFIGNIKAAGVAINLTAASRCVFAELDWVPGNITQAEDRLHRMGQQDSVHVQHLVLENSIDAYMAKILVAKQDLIDRAMGDTVEQKDLLNELLLTYNF